MLLGYFFVKGSFVGIYTVFISSWNRIAANKLDSFLLYNTPVHPVPQGPDDLTQDLLGPPHLYEYSRTLHLVHFKLVVLMNSSVSKLRNAFLIIVK